MPDRGAEEHLNVAVDIHIVIGPLISQDWHCLSSAKTTDFYGNLLGGSFRPGEVSR